MVTSLAIVGQILGMGWKRRRSLKKDVVYRLTTSTFPTDWKVKPSLNFPIEVLPRTVES